MIVKTKDGRTFDIKPHFRTANDVVHVLGDMDLEHEGAELDCGIVVKVVDESFTDDVPTCLDCIAQVTARERAGKVLLGYKLGQEVQESYVEHLRKKYFMNGDDE